MSNESVGTMKDPIAIITGGSRGLGRNTAVNLAKRGVDIIFTFHSNQKEAEALIREVETLEEKQPDLAGKRSECDAAEGLYRRGHANPKKFTRDYRGLRRKSKATTFR